MSIIILESHLFPCIVYSSAIFCNTAKLEACENYQKRSFRNKFVIGGFDGPHILSVPLKRGKHLKMPIREVEISYDQNWQDIHTRTIQTAYGNSPFFSYYKDDLLSLYEQPGKNLFDFAIKSIQWTFDALQQNIMIELTEKYCKTYEPPAKDLRNLIHPGNYKRFKISEYWQIFTERNGFASNLSILDLLFHLGPDSLQYLKTVYLPPTTVTDMP